MRREGVRKLWKLGTALKVMALMGGNIAICHGEIIYDAVEISLPPKQHLKKIEKKEWGEKGENLYPYPQQIIPGASGAETITPQRPSLQLLRLQ